MKISKPFMKCLNIPPFEKYMTLYVDMLDKQQVIKDLTGELLEVPNIQAVPIFTYQATPMMLSVTFIHYDGVCRLRQAFRSSWESKVAHNEFMTQRWGYNDGILEIVKGTLDCSYENLGLEHYAIFQQPFLTMVKYVNTLLVMASLSNTRRVFDQVDFKQLLKVVRCLFPLSDEQLADANYPTRENFEYLLWKGVFKGWCEHSFFVKGNFIDHFMGTTRLLTNQFYIEYASEGLHQYVYSEYWNLDSMTWKDKVVDVCGNTHPIFVHHHEIQWRNAQECQCPDNVMIPPKEHYRLAFERTVQGKVKRLMDIKPFRNVKASDFDEYASQVTMIENSLALIVEGRVMQHCIGGETYIDNGARGQTIFFRFIPKGVDVKDLENQYTVTLGRTRPITKYVNPDIFDDNRLHPVDRERCLSNEPMRQQHYKGIWLHQIAEGKKKFWFTLHEVWGFKNRVPPESVIIDIYTLIWKNRQFLKDLANTSFDD